MLRTLAIALFLTFSTQALACDITEDSIKILIASEPSRLVRVLEGNDLTHFLIAAQREKYLIGMISAERVYIVDAGSTEPSHAPDNVWMYFILDGCMATAIPGEKSIIMGLLP